MEYSKRKLQRLIGFDYSNQYYYYVTICTGNKKCIFRDVHLNLSDHGIIAKTNLMNIPNHFNCVKIDKYVIMPNHIHAIIIIGCEDETKQTKSFPTLSMIIGLYKSGVSKQIHEVDSTLTIWQSSFHDHIIRNEKGYEEIWQYIDQNLVKWAEDELYIK